MRSGAGSFTDIAVPSTVHVIPPVPVLAALSLFCFCLFRSAVVLLCALRGVTDLPMAAPLCDVQTPSEASAVEARPSVADVVDAIVLEHLRQDVSLQSSPFAAAAAAAGSHGVRDNSTSAVFGFTSPMPVASPLAPPPPLHQTPQQPQPQQQPQAQQQPQPQPAVALAVTSVDRVSTTR